MRVLALDTTTRAGSVALVADERVVDERAGDGTRTHALRLPGGKRHAMRVSGHPNVTCVGMCTRVGLSPT